MRTSINLLRHRCLALLAAATAALFTGGAQGAPRGELDGSFGENGLAMFGSRFDITFGAAVVQQPDGKLVVAGSTWDSTSALFDFVVYRLEANGSPDGSFGNDGVVRIDFRGLKDFATDLAIQPDGRIVVAGYAETVETDFDVALVRLDPDGGIDPTFGNDGKTLLGLGGRNEYPARLVLLPNGRLVVAGATDADGDYDAYFARFHADGSPDAGFGTGPIAGTTVIDTGTDHDLPYAMTQQPDGKLVACGQSGPTAFVGTGGQMLALRVNADGSVDTGFGTEGVSVVSPTGAKSGARGCIALPGGRVLLAGFVNAAGNTDLLLARLATDGELDTAFATAGFSRIDLGGSESAQTIIQLADGDLALTGSTAALESETSLAPNPLWGYNMPADYSDVLFARVDGSSGALDPDFGNDGVTLVDFGETSSASLAFGRGILQQADGKLVAVGARVEWGDWWNLHRLALTRVDPAGAGNAGIASFTTSHAQFIEGGAPATFSVRRTGGSTGVLSVDYATVAQTAGSPGDFTAQSGTLTWASGDTEPKSITVSITNDDDREDLEYFTVELAGADPHLGLQNLFVSVRNEDGPLPPPGAPQAGGSSSSGGGGATGLELLLLLAMVAGLAARRRRNV